MRFERLRDASSIAASFGNANEIDLFVLTLNAPIGRERLERSARIVDDAHLQVIVGALLEQALDA